MIFTRKMKHQNKRYLSHLMESLNDFFGKITEAGVAEGGTVESQNGPLVSICGVEALSENTASYNQVIRKDIADRIRIEVDNVVAAVKNWVHDSIFTAMDSVAVLKV